MYIILPERLFVRNIDILRETIKTPKEDDLFESARLLRQLLVDENPLLHQVNRARRIKIIFHANLPSKLQRAWSPTSIGCWRGFHRGSDGPGEHRQRS